MITAHSQQVRRVYLRDFRTYENTLVELPPGLSIFYGPNAVGKTTFLEAVHVLLTTRSPRTFTDAEMVRSGAQTFFLKASITVPDTESTVEILFDKDRGKSVRVNGSTPPTMDTLLRRFPAVYFSPDEIRIVTGAPFWRRVFLDQLLSQLSATYSDHLAKYRSVLAQRNTTLRDMRTGRASGALLGVWDEQLTLHGGALVAARLDAIARLNQSLAREYVRISQAEQVTMAYVSAIPYAQDDPEGNPADRIARALEENRDVEQDRGHTITGPHRDDLAITLDGMDARVYASQGQRRSLVLGLKLAASSLLAAETDCRPVLLLDDVFSELDRTRRRHLCVLAEEGYQVLITATDRGMAEEMNCQGGTYFSVGKGVISPA